MTDKEQNISNNFPPLPKGWILTEIVKILSDCESGSRPAVGVKKITSGIPSIGGEHLTYSDEFNFSNLRFIPNDFLKKMNRGIIKRFDVLVVKDGATTGKTVFVGHSFPFEKAAVNEHVFIFRVFHSLFNARYLSFWMQSQDGQKCVNENFKGTAQGGINSTFITNAKFPISPLPEQHSIVTKIEELFTKFDAGVKSLKEIQKHLKRYRQSVLKVAFEGKLTAEWREAHKSELEPASALLERIKIERKEKLGKKYKACPERSRSELPPIDTSELPELPNGWAWSCLGEVITVSSGNGLTSSKMKIDGKYPVYGGNGISGYYDSYMFEESRLIIGRVGAKCGVVHITEPFSWITDNALITDFVYIDIRYMYYLLQVVNLNQYSVSTAQPVISGAKIYPVVISLPSILEQQQIVSEIERHFSVAEAVEKIVEQSLAQAERLCQSILKKAFEGKLVPQDPSDPPASVLLEQIKLEKEKNIERIKKEKDKTAKIAKKRKGLGDPLRP
ncbi:MAG: restriction endonuclease subunit S [Bacteroidota bacterium]|nr:restriction endonuclease subunit S [Bacteroidota bacterium]